MDTDTRRLHDAMYFAKAKINFLDMLQNVTRIDQIERIIGE